jgi:hypothetical protein
MRAGSPALAPKYEHSRRQVVPSPRQYFLLAMFAEYRRAAAAAQRYTDLRYRNARRGSIVLSDIPRQVFEEFYSSDEAAESRGLQRASVRFARMVNLHLRDEIALVSQRSSEAAAAFGARASSSTDVVRHGCERRQWDQQAGSRSRGPVGWRGMVADPFHRDREAPDLVR